MATMPITSSPTIHSIDVEQFEAPMDKAALAIPLEEFDVITAFGTDRLRAAILVEPKIQQ
jgi:hypothetical protein